MNTPFSFQSPTTQVVDQKAPDLPVPAQTPDGDSYLCGNAGPEHSYANPGRDQDRSRVDECIAASPFARYVG